MGGDPEKLRVLIPTTAGPAEVLLLTEEDSAVGRSVACIGGTTDTADIAAGYHAFVARPTGIVESLFGHSCYRLDVSARIDAGTSWQLGVLAAHALHAVGRLAQEYELADGVLWATGSVRAVDLTVGAVSHIPEKVASSWLRLAQEAQEGRRVLAAIPAQNTAQLSADLRSELKAGGVEILELDHVQPLWDALAIKLSAGPRKAASNLATEASASRHGRRAWGAAAAVILGIASVASVTAYLLMRPRSLIVELPAEAAPPPARSESIALVPESVPFISQQEQDKIRSVYLPAQTNKALAINLNRIFIASAQTDEKTASEAAVATCQQLTEANGGEPSRCELYAIGNFVVSKRDRPPMPPQPWFVHDPSVERRFAAAEVPLVSEENRKPLERFLSRPRSKALALSATGYTSAFYGESSADQASRRALERCAYSAGVACMIIAIQDAFVVQVPKSAKVVGFFRPESLDAVSPELREDVARQLGDAGSGWRALAIGAGGRVGIKLGAESEKAAVDGSLQACRAQDGDCRVAVIGPFLVEGGN